MTAIDYGHPRRCPYCRQAPVLQHGKGIGARFRFICTRCNVAGLWKRSAGQAVIGWNDPGGIAPVIY